ncbi:MAG: calcium-binding protein, partial [Variibacter sp.]
MTIIINENTIWAANSIHNLTDDIQIAPGVTLTIEAGATVNGAGHHLQAYGTLHVSGTASNAAVLNNIEMGFGINNDANPGRIEISFAQISGGSLFDPTGYGSYGSFSITDSVLSDLHSSYSKGMYIWYPVGDSSFERNLFVRSPGLSIGSSNVNVSVVDNTFLDWTTDQAIENWASYGTASTIVEHNSFISSVHKPALVVPIGYSNARIDASENYFGTADPSVVASMILDRADDLGRASYINPSFLSAPHKDAPGIVGTQSNDVLRDTGVADIFAGSMYGFAGNDIYIVHDARHQAVEVAGNGTDQVYSSVDYTLAAGQSIEILNTLGSSTTANINLTGNELNNTLVGNAGMNRLNGGGGVDKMYGFGGDDIYIVDNASDQVFESAGNGTDQVYSSVNYTLAAGQSIEVLNTMGSSSTANINLTGNERSEERR